MRQINLSWLKFATDNIELANGQLATLLWMNKKSGLRDTAQARKIFTPPQRVQGVIIQESISYWWCRNDVCYYRLVGSLYGHLGSDGAGAVILSKTTPGYGVLSLHLGADGSDLLNCRWVLLVYLYQKKLWKISFILSVWMAMRL